MPGPQGSDLFHIYLPPPPPPMLFIISMGYLQRSRLPPCEVASCALGLPRAKRSGVAAQKYWEQSSVVNNWGYNSMTRSHQIY